MILTKNSGGGEFQPHPETDGLVRAVIVDVTPLKKVETEFGPKEKFRLVYETEATKEDGTRHCVWSSGYTASLHEKAAFRKDIKKILGRDLTVQEELSFDTESMLGMGVQLIVKHEHKDDKVYANIAFVGPDRGAPLKASGKYIRVKDREHKDGEGGEKAVYKKADQPADAGRSDWQKTKVHVGKHAGVDLGDLDGDAVAALLEKWMPMYEKSEKRTADDKRLAAALLEAKRLLAEAGQDENCDF